MPESGLENRVSAPETCAKKERLNFNPITKLELYHAIKIARIPVTKFRINQEILNLVVTLLIPISNNFQSKTSNLDHSKPLPLQKSTLTQIATNISVLEEGISEALDQRLLMSSGPLNH